MVFNIIYIIYSTKITSTNRFHPIIVEQIFNLFNSNATLHNK